MLGRFFLKHGRDTFVNHRALEPHLPGEEDAAHPAPAESALEPVCTAEIGLQLVAELGCHAAPRDDGQVAS
jgi:hypothetical protein